MLCLDKNMLLLLKLRSLIEKGDSVPARECVNRNGEQVLILENIISLIMPVHKNLISFQICKIVFDLLHTIGS